MLFAFLTGVVHEIVVGLATESAKGRYSATALETRHAESARALYAELTINLDNLLQKIGEQQRFLDSGKFEESRRAIELAIEADRRAVGTLLARSKMVTQKQWQTLEDFEKGVLQRLREAVQKIAHTPLSEVTGNNQSLQKSLEATKDAALQAGKRSGAAAPGDGKLYFEHLEEGLLLAMGALGQDFIRQLDRELDEVSRQRIHSPAAVKSYPQVETEADVQFLSGAAAVLGPCVWLGCYLHFDALPSVAFGLGVAGGFGALVYGLRGKLDSDGRLDDLAEQQKRAAEATRNLFESEFVSRGQARLAEIKAQVSYAATVRHNFELFLRLSDELVWESCPEELDNLNVSK